ncbi:hypothetical protein [Actinomadura sp. DC4]|uniref:hypothetical protein n=1 Tax=Actinomadura sp. DC4 TaxID=3055069 RepID=UPI0025B15C20|nr:hypothetical protein [Actinomadura sp. DC4]
MSVAVVLAGTLTACGSGSDVGASPCKLITKADVQKTISGMVAKEPSENGGKGYRGCSYGDAKPASSYYVDILVDWHAGRAGFNGERKAAMAKTGSVVRAIDGVGDEAFSYVAPGGFSTGAVEARRGSVTVRVSVTADDPVRYSKEFVEIALRRL